MVEQLTRNEVAVYIVAAKAMKESFWPHGLVNQQGKLHKTVIVHCDNERTTHLIKNQMFDDLSEYIDVTVCVCRLLLYGG